MSHAARFALESMPYPEAGAALCAALDDTSGETKVGIVNSLGQRRERAAVPALIALAKDADAQLAAAAAAALGKTGTKKATNALRELKSTAPDALQLTVSDALLECAEQRLAKGNRKGARALYEDLRSTGEPTHVRVAAFRGIAFAAGSKAMAVVTAGLTGGDPETESAALGLLVELKGGAIAKDIEALLPKVTPRMQAALLQAVAQRGDRTLAPTVAAMVKSEYPEVRIAALAAVAATGDASSVPLLAQVATNTAGGGAGSGARRPGPTSRGGSE